MLLFLPRLLGLGWQKSSGKGLFMTRGAFLDADATDSFDW